MNSPYIITAMGRDRIRFDIASINIRSLEKMMDMIILGIYSDTLPKVSVFKSEEYFQIQKEAQILLKEILNEKKEMMDYVTTSLQRGGYYHRMICQLFSIYSFEISFPDDNTILIHSPTNIVVYRNGIVQLIAKSPERNTHN